MFFRLSITIAILFAIFHYLINPKKLRVIKARLTHPMSIGVLLFILIGFLTSLTGLNSGNSIWSNFERGEGAFQLLHYGALYFLIISVFFTRKNIEHLFKVHLVTAGLVTGYGIMQLIQGKEGTGMIISAAGEFSGSLGNPSYLALYILLSLGVLGYFFAKAKEVKSRYILGGLGIIFIWTIIQSGNKGALIGLFFGLLAVLVALFFVSKNSRVKKISGATFISLFTLAIFFFITKDLSFWGSIPFIGDSLNYKVALNEIQPRLWTWASSLMAFMDRPILGWGLENFPMAFDIYYDPRHFKIESFFDRTHNIFLEYLISGGVLLLGSWLAIFYGYFMKLVKSTKDNWFIVKLAFPVAYFVAAFFLFDVLAVYVVLFVFLAGSLVLETETDEQIGLGGNIYLPKVISMGVLTIGSILILYFTSYVPLVKNKLISSAIYSQQAGDPNKTLTAFTQALEYKSPVGNEETLSMLMRYSANLINATDLQNHEVYISEDGRRQVRALLKFNNDWFIKSQEYLVSQKDVFLLGSLYFRGATSFDPETGETFIVDQELLDYGKQLFNEVIEKYPTRVEFMEFLIASARLEGDMERLDYLIGLAEELRPDHDWLATR